MTLKVGNWYFSCALHQLDAGEEVPVIKELAKTNSAILFKALGHFDLAYLTRFETTDDIFFDYSKVPPIKQVSVITGVPFDGPYKSPDVIQFCKESSFLGFVCLEIDKWLYSPEAGLGSCLQACIQIIEKVQKEAESRNLKIAFFGGYGRSELLLLLNSNDCTELFKLVEFVRNIRLKDLLGPGQSSKDPDLPVITNTNTIPLVSYNKIDEEKFSVTDVIGNVRFSVNIKCQSGSESIIKKYFYEKEDYIIYNTLGTADITLISKNQIQISKLVEDILRFRSYWRSEYHNSPISTLTQIHWDFNSKNNVPISYEITKSALEFKIPDELVSKNRNLSKSASYCLNQLNSLISDRSTFVTVIQLTDASTYIKDSLDEYVASVNIGDHLEIYRIEGLLQEFIDTIFLGIQQRLASSFTQYQSSGFLPIPFSNGISSNLFAIELFIRHCFSSWGKCNSSTYAGEPDWIGFSVFSDNFGFKLRVGEVIFLPLAAAVRPFSSEGNWLTVTHEISHAIYTRSNIGEKYKEQFDLLRDELYSNTCDENSAICLNFDDLIFELFAHWYDFYHFYNKDIELYLKSIWASWLCLPIVHVNLSDYFLRSFVVYIFKDMDEIYKVIKKDRHSFDDFIKNCWHEHLKKLNLRSSDKEYIGSQSNEIIHLIDYVISLLILIFGENVDDNFRTEVNKSYKKLDEHCESILTGNIVFEKIENPFSLFKKLWAHSFNSDSAKVNNSLLLSLMNNSVFLIECDVE